MDEQEQAAVEAFRRGDFAGLEVLMQLHQLRAVRTAYLITGDWQVAEDVAADAFLTAYERRGQLDVQRPFAPWFYRIVVNGALKITRETRRRWLGRDDGTDLLEQQIDPSPGPEDEAAHREVQQAVYAAIQALPSRQRTVLVLRYYLGMDESAIAEILRCPLGTVKWRLHAARQQLRERFGEALREFA